MIIEIPKICKFCNNKDLTLINPNDRFQDIIDYECKECNSYRIVANQENINLIIDTDNPRVGFEEFTFYDLHLNVTNVYSEFSCEIYKFKTDPSKDLILDSLILESLLDFSDVLKLKNKLKIITTFQ